MENSNCQQIPTQRFSTKDGFFSESSTVNLTRIPRQHTDVPSNLDLCNDELFDELFPNSQKPSASLQNQPQSVLYGHIANELRKNTLNTINESSAPGTSSLLPQSLPQQLNNLRMSAPDVPDQHHRRPHQLSESSAIEQHMMYLMDQTPNPVPLQVTEVHEPVPYVKSEPREMDSSPEQIQNKNKEQACQQDLWVPIPSSFSIPKTSRKISSESDEEYIPSLSSSTKELVSNMIKAEPVDIEELTKKRSKRGRKRKSTESENELTRAYDRENNEYKKKRLRNNIAVRKSRDKAKNRQMEIQGKLMELANENKNQKEVIGKLKEDFDKLEACFNERTARLEESIKLNVRMRQFINDLPPEFQPKFSI